MKKMKEKKTKLIISDSRNFLGSFRCLVEIGKKKQCQNHRFNGFNIGYPTLICAFYVYINSFIKVKTENSSPFHPATNATVVYRSKNIYFQTICFQNNRSK